MKEGIETVKRYEELIGQIKNAAGFLLWTIEQWEQEQAIDAGKDMEICEN